jgi:hypothetical protein
MGRWMSPDIINVTEARLAHPANTLNKYVYGGNNPLKYVDPDGEDIVVAFEANTGFPGHVMLFANNPTNGQSALMSFGPTDRSASGQALELAGGPVESTKSFGLPTNLSDLKEHYSSLTIQTTPEEAQKIIDQINKMSTNENPYMLYQTNCTTVVRELLKSIGLLPKDDTTWVPGDFWGEIGNKFGNGVGPQGPGYEFSWSNPTVGFDYGRARFGGSNRWNTFDWMQLLMKGDGSSVTTTQTVTLPDGTKQSY